MIGWLLHRLMNPRHRAVRWGLFHPGLVCNTCDKEWLPAAAWYRVLDR